MRQKVKWPMKLECASNLCGRKVVLNNDGLRAFAKGYARPTPSLEMIEAEHLGDFKRRYERATSRFNPEGKIVVIPCEVVAVYPFQSFQNAHDKQGHISLRLSVLLPSGRLGTVSIDDVRVVK